MNSSSFDPTPLRAQFPSLRLWFERFPAVFFDNPGGTQVPQRVIDAVTRYYREQNANSGGDFSTSRQTDTVIGGAREAMADLLNAQSSSEIVFGPNMTSLTFHLARSLGRTIRPGDEIVVTDLDHDANVAPWMDLELVGATIRVAGIHPEDCTLDMESLRSCINERTRLVAVTHASNAVGTIPDVAAIVHMAHEAGALVFLDAVQYAPHAPIDVQALDCDFLVCSAYKFFGPHVGVLYGKAEHLQRLNPHKVRPAKDSIPNCWETGTMNHEGLAGVEAAVEYLEDIGRRFGESFAPEFSEYEDRRRSLKCAMRAIKVYEQSLSERLLTRLGAIPGIHIHGITDLNRLDSRLPTIAFTWPHASAQATAAYLGGFGFCCWSGNYYAVRLMERLGLESTGGAVRIGAVHYNTCEEIDHLTERLLTVPTLR